MKHFPVLKRILSGGGGILSSKFISKAIGFIFIILLTRSLSTEEYGIFALAYSIVTLSKNIATFGLATTVQKYLSGNGKNRNNNFFGVVSLIVTISSLTIGGLLFLFADFVSVNFFNNAELIEILQILSIEIVLGAPFLVLIAVLRAKEKIKTHFYFEVFNRIFRFLSVAICVFFTSQVIFVAWGIVVSQAVSLALLVKYFIRIKVNFTLLDFKNKATEILFYTLPLMFVGFSYLLIQQADRILIGIFEKENQVGIYTAVSSLALISSTIYSSFVYIFMPIAAEALRNDNSKQLEFCYAFLSKWMGILNGIILAIFSAFGLLILNIFGTDYSTNAGYSVLLILTTFYFIGGWVGPTEALLQMANKQYLELFNTIVFISSNILLNIILIPVFGIIGAAFATLISGLIRNIIQVYQINEFVSVKKNILKKSNLIVLFITVLSTLLIYITKNIYYLPEFIFIIYIIIIFIISFLYLEDYEIDLFLTVRDKLIKYNFN